MCLYIASKNNSSWSLRPWVLMQNIGIEFDEPLVSFGRHEFGLAQPVM